MLLLRYYLLSWVAILLATIVAGAVTLAAATAIRLFGPVPWLLRTYDAGWASLRALDIVGCTYWFAPLYVLRLADKPSGRKMISSYVGFAAYNGHRWALLVQVLIDRGATLLGDAPRHCYRAFRDYEGLDR